MMIERDFADSETDNQDDDLADNEKRFGRQ